jgi:hypothetical protein
MNTDEMHDQIPDAEVIVNPLTLQPIENSKLESIAKLAASYVKYQQTIDNLEAQLDVASKEFQRHQMELLPAAMEEIGLNSLTLSNGIKLSIAPFYSGSIPPNDGKDADPVRRAKCFAWLREHNFGSLIKTEVKVIAGKGDEALVEKTVAVLKDQEIPFVQADNVHHMTLKAFVREQCEAATPPPVELFKTFQGKKAVIGK